MYKKIITPLAIAAIIAGCGAPKQAARPVPPPPKKEVYVPPAPPTVEGQPATKVEIANTLSTTEKAAGWKLLFDGYTTDGWHTYGSKTIGTAWKVANGALYLDAAAKNSYQAATGGDIVTDEEYGNFELQLDWKISPGGNSGIILYSKEDKKYGTMWMTGPEMQILDDAKHSDGKIYKHNSGDLYDLIASSKLATNPVGFWNHVLIRSYNGQLSFYLNGVNIVNTTMWNDNWRSMIANSKFRDMPDFGTYRTGRIGLQDHGNEVAFRNIKIRRL